MSFHFLTKDINKLTRNQPLDAFNSIHKCAFKCGVHPFTRLYCWIGTLDCAICFGFTHVVVDLLDSYWLSALREHVIHHSNDEYEQWNKHKLSTKDFTICYQYSYALTCHYQIPFYWPHWHQ